MKVRMMKMMMLRPGRRRREGAAFPLAGACALLMLALLPGRLGAEDGRHRSPSERRGPGRTAPPTRGEILAGLGAPSCLDCDLLYASYGGGVLGWVALPDDPGGFGSAGVVGTMPDEMIDLGVTSDGRLFGITPTGDLYEIDPCDASGTFARNIPGAGAGLAGDPMSTDLFVAGPPLLRVETTSGAFSVTRIGGEIGPALPAWCSEARDIAVSPDDGLIYATVPCPTCPVPPPTGGDLLTVIDPATGEMLAEIGCVHDPGSFNLQKIDGLAFLLDGRLFGRVQITTNGTIVGIDPATAHVIPPSVFTGRLFMTGLAACVRAPAACECRIDIKPGSDTNPIQPASRGVIPVAVLGSASFDVREIDPSTVTFGPGAAPPAHGVGLHLEDVDDDGLDDAVFHFRTRETGILEGDIEACLTFTTFAGESASCCDAVVTVP